MNDNENLDETLMALTADIVAAHVSNNSVSVNDLPQLIQNVHGALSGISGSASAPEAKPEPKVPIRSSIKPDYIVCLEDGKKLKMLKRHLMTHYSDDARPVSPEMGSCRRLSDGRAQLCRTAPRARQVDRPRHQAPQDQGSTLESHGNRGGAPNAVPFSLTGALRLTKTHAHARSTSKPFAPTRACGSPSSAGRSPASCRESRGPSRRRDAPRARRRGRPQDLDRHGLSHRPPVRGGRHPRAPRIRRRPLALRSGLRRPSRPSDRRRDRQCHRVRR